MACPVKLCLLFVLNCLMSLYGCVAANKTNPYLVGTEVNVDLPMHMKEQEEKSVTFTIVNYQNTVFRIIPVAADPDLLETRSNLSYYLGPKETNNFTARIKGMLLGRTFLRLFVNTTPVDPEPDSYDYVLQHEPDHNDWYELPDKYEVTISRVESALSHSFTGMVIVLVCLANVAMGCKTELAVVKEVLRKPVGPATGMFSQFILMPLKFDAMSTNLGAFEMSSALWVSIGALLRMCLNVTRKPPEVNKQNISLAVIYLLRFDPANALGFFAMACSPGGAASNAYSYLLAGDVSLSVTMTLCSVLLSLGMIPLWLFTVGAKVLYQTDVEIPFMNILTSLVGLLIPVAIGMLIQWKKPNWAKYIVKGIRPLMIIFFIFVFTVGVYSNLFIFTLMRNKLEILLAGALIPYVGFLFGGIVAWVTRQSWKRIRTIAIETGIQNTGIAIVLLKVSLPPPDNDISIVAPIAAAIFTPIPMVIAIIWYEVYKRCYKNEHKALYIDDHEGESDIDIGKEVEENGMNHVELKNNNSHL